MGEYLKLFIDEIFKAPKCMKTLQKKRYNEEKVKKKNQEIFIFSEVEESRIKKVKFKKLKVTSL